MALDGIKLAEQVGEYHKNLVERGLNEALAGRLVEKFAERVMYSMDAVGVNDSIMRLLQSKIITDVEARSLMIEAGNLNLAI